MEKENTEKSLSLLSRKSEKNPLQGNMIGVDVVDNGLMK